jgi:hypothetical protein
LSSLAAGAGAGSVFDLVFVDFEVFFFAAAVGAGVCALTMVASESERRSMWGVSEQRGERIEGSTSIGPGRRWLRLQLARDGHAGIGKHGSRARSTDATAIGRLSLRPSASRFWVRRLDAARLQCGP